MSYLDKSMLRWSINLAAASFLAGCVANAIGWDVWALSMWAGSATMMWIHLDRRQRAPTSLTPEE